MMMEKKTRINICIILNLIQYKKTLVTYYYYLFFVFVLFESMKSVEPLNLLPRYNSSFEKFHRKKEKRFNRSLLLPRFHSYHDENQSADVEINQIKKTIDEVKQINYYQEKFDM